MRRFLACLSLACAVSLSAVETEAPEVARAKEEAARVKALVDAGVLPANRLQQAEESLAEATDDAVLRRTLYGAVSVEELTERDTGEMVAAARRRLERQEDRISRAWKVIEEGAASRLSLEPLTEECARRQEVLSLAESRARLLKELAEMARAEQSFGEEIVSTPQGGAPLVERFDGSGVFRLGSLASISRAFAAQFARALPVSARGDTAVHRALGFDHRGRVDIALDPDQPEGVWLRRHLERSAIPYYAFRSALPGRATAPHIHIGPPSGRLRGGG